MIDASLFPALQTFLSVARAGAVGAAARAHHVTSSAVSQQVRRLETYFGVKLLERAGRGVRLTAAGEAALPVMRALWVEAESAFGQLGELAGHPAVTIRVAASDYLGRALLAPVLRDLLEAEPPLRFEIVTAHSRAAMRLIAAADVDLAVVTGQDAPRGLETQHLFDQPFAWVGPRRGRRDREPLAERLRREPVLRLALESRGRAVLDQYLAEERIRPVSTIDVPSVSLLLSYVSGGLGIGLVPALALAELPASRSTDGAGARVHGAVVAEPARVPPLPVTLVRRPAARPQPALARLVSRLTAEGRRVGARLVRWPRAAPAPASRRGRSLSPARPASRARLAAGR